MCPKCDSLYELKDCIKHNSNGSIESKTCRHVATPDHPHRSRRLACGCVLLKKQRTKKKTILIPRKLYPYRPVKKSLEILLNRPGFMDKCEKWRSRRNNQQASEYLGDVYDGEIWRIFKSADREFKNFLSTAHSYLL